MGIYFLETSNEVGGLNTNRDTTLRNSTVADTDQLFIEPDVDLVSQFETIESHNETDAAIDGVAVFSFDRAEGTARVVFFSPGFAAMVGEKNLVLGQESQDIFGPTKVQNRLAPIFFQLIDNPENRSLALAQTLKRDPHSALPVHVTYSLLQQSAANGQHLCVGLFRDLTKESAESLLDEHIEVVASLGRGKTLGASCFQLCKQLEAHLANSSQCWLGIRGENGSVEPVVFGNCEIGHLQGIFDLVLKRATTNKPWAAHVSEMPADIADKLVGDGVAMLWIVPLLAEHQQTSFWEPDQSDIQGFLIVATDSMVEPQEPQITLLTQAASYIATEISEATQVAVDNYRDSHDELTHLPNRSLVLDRLSDSLASLTQDAAISVFLVDLNRFKSINHVHGSHIGDIVLKEIADRLLAAVRLGDTIGRISSDQYLMVCSSSSGELDAAAIAQRITNCVSEPIYLPDTSKLTVTASVGIVLIEDRTAAPASILSQAESALSKAAAKGRGCYAYYDETLRQQTDAKLEIEEALKAAIKNDELVVHYQPLVDLRTSKMVGAEALVRWQRPGYGLVSPIDFIPVAEETGLISQMGVIIIDEVCKDLASWPKVSGRLPVVTVNLSAKQLVDDTLVISVVSALRRHDLHPRCLGFEITESMEIVNPTRALETLNKLRELGCRVAIDDFGIGYATLDYLRRFSMANALKVDRSFVTGLGVSREDNAIVSASVALASSLDMHIVAEGVETQQQLEILRNMGCSYAQGYGFSKPVAVEKAMQLWEEQTLLLEI